MKNKEVLKKSYEIDYIVQLIDLLQFHYLVAQKTEQSKFVTLETFEVEITFDDKTSRILYGLEALQSFTETRNLTVDSVQMTWTCLLQKDASTIPEKQVVTVRFETTENIVRPGVREPIQKNLGKALVIIDHSNAIWAGEVLSHFDNQIASINTNTSWLFRLCRFIRQHPAIHKAMMWLLIASVLGVGYMSFQWTDISKRPTRDAEVYYDLATALDEGTLSNYVKKDTPDDLVLRIYLADQRSFLQYFVIRDLFQEGNVGVLDSLKESEYFSKHYQPILEKMKGGYYDDQTTSERIVNTVWAQIRSEKASNNIRFAYNYLRWAVLIVFLYYAGAVYLWIFANRSMIAITAKGMRLQKAQESRKANSLQIVYGVAATFIAAGIVFLFQLISFP